MRRPFPNTRLTLILSRHGTSLIKWWKLQRNRPKRIPFFAPANLQRPVKVDRTKPTASSNHFCSVFISSLRPRNLRGRCRGKPTPQRDRAPRRSNVIRVHSTAQSPPFTSHLPLFTLLLDWCNNVLAGICFSFPARMRVAEDPSFLDQFGTAVLRTLFCAELLEDCERRSSFYEEKAKQLTSLMYPIAVVYTGSLGPCCFTSNNWPRQWALRLALRLFANCRGKTLRLRK